MIDLFDAGFADALQGDEPVLLNLDENEAALYERGFAEGLLVRDLLEAK